MAVEDRRLDIDPAAASAVVFLSGAVWQSRRAIAIFTACLMIVAILVWSLSAPIYRATLTAYPQSDRLAGGGLRGLAASLGGLSADQALGGTSVGPSVSESIAIVNSRELALKFVHRHNLLPILFPKQWDAQTGKWKPPSAFSQFMASLQGRSAPTGKPSDEAAYRLFRKLLTVGLDERTGIVTVTIEWRDPQQAAEWANGLVNDANEQLRTRAIANSENGLKYLEQQAASSTQSEMRNAVFAVAQSEIMKGMLARVQQNFALKILDPASPPEFKAWPHLSILLAVAILAGVFFGSVGAILSQYIRELRGIAGVPMREPGSFWKWPGRIVRSISMRKGGNREAASEASSRW